MLNTSSFSLKAEHNVPSIGKALITSTAGSPSKCDKSGYTHILKKRIFELKLHLQAKLWIHLGLSTKLPHLVQGKVSSPGVSGIVGGAF